MKNKILPDLVVYILSPIIVLSLSSISKVTYFIEIGLLFLISIYTIILKVKYNRVNLSGIVLALLYTIFYSYRQSIELGYDSYIYNTYFMIISSIIIVSISLINKNVIKQIYIDILKCKGISLLDIWNKVKKIENTYLFNKINYTVLLHILSIILIRFYSINFYGADDYTYTKDLEILINILFIMGEIYLASKLFNNKEKSIVVNRSIKLDNSSKRVINFNQYKNMNK